MKNRNNLTINQLNMLNDNELTNLKGGTEPGGSGCNLFFCGCYGVPDSWWKCYCSIQGMSFDLQQRCGGL